MNNSKSSLLLEAYTGAKDSLPLIIAAMPFGLVFGALGQAQGLPDWVILGISMIVFAGASQFIAITMLASGAAFPIIVLTVFIVNLRHVLYGISLIPVVRGLSAGRRALMAFGITDETFAVVFNRVSQTGETNQSSYYLGSMLFMYSNWILCTWLGIIAGNELPAVTSFGLDIAMVVAFIGIIVANLRLPSHWFCALTATISALLTYHWPHQSGLLFSSVVAIGVGVYTENKLTGSKRNEQ